MGRGCSINPKANAKGKAYVSAHAMLPLLVVSGVACDLCASAEFDRVLVVADGRHGQEHLRLPDRNPVW